MSAPPERPRRLPVEDLLGALGSQAEGIWSKLLPPAGRGGVVRTLFTSAEAGAGCTTIAAVTGYDLALNLRARVVLIEAHLRRPTLAGLFGLSATPGFSDLLDGRAELARCLQEVPGVPSLRLLPGGHPRPPLRGELSTPESRRHLAALAAEADFLLIDAPPVLAGAETRLLLEQVDNAVLVLRARTTRRDAARQAVAAIEDAGVPLIGAVLNRYEPELHFLG